MFRVTLRFRVLLLGVMTFALPCTPAPTTWHGSSGPDANDISTTNVFSLDMDLNNALYRLAQDTSTTINLIHPGGLTSISHSISALEYHNESPCIPMQSACEASVIVDTESTPNRACILLAKDMYDSCGNAAPVFMYAVVELSATPTYLVNPVLIELGGESNPMLWFNGGNCAEPGGIGNYSYADLGTDISEDDIHIEEAQTKVSVAFTGGKFWLACSYSAFIEQEHNAASVSYEEHVETYLFTLDPSSSWALSHQNEFSNFCGFGPATPGLPEVNRIESAGVRDSATDKYLLLVGSPYQGGFEYGVNITTPSIFVTTATERSSWSYKLGDAAGKIGLAYLTELLNPVPGELKDVMYYRIYDATNGSWGTGGSSMVAENAIRGVDVCVNNNVGYVYAATSSGGGGGVYLYRNSVGLHNVIAHYAGNSWADRLVVHSDCTPKYLYLEYGVEGKKGRIDWYEGILGE